MAALNAIFPDRFRIIMYKIITVQLFQVKTFLLVQHHGTWSRSTGTDFQQSDSIRSRPFIKDKAKQTACNTSPLERLTYGKVQYFCPVYRLFLNNISLLRLVLHTKRQNNRMFSDNYLPTRGSDPLTEANHKDSLSFVQYVSPYQAIISTIFPSGSAMAPS